MPEVPYTVPSPGRRLAAIPHGYRRAVTLLAEQDVEAVLRVVPLQAVHNLRDLGGYPTADGCVTRWRRLYRADGLQRLAGDDLEEQ